MTDRSTEIDSGAGTATALIDAAEARFAESGIEQASLRAVMRDAGTDPGAIHYHFGGRESLAAAVLDRILVPLNQQRLQLLEELEHAPAHGPAGPAGRTAIEALIEAIIRPDIEMAHTVEQRGPGRSRLIGSIYLHPSAFVTSQVEGRFAPVAQRFLPHLITAAPGVPPDLLAWRIRWCLFGTVGAVLVDPAESFKMPPDQLVQRLVTTLAPAIVAPAEPKEY